MKILNKPVAMVATFDKDGNVTLVRFQLKDENGENQTIKIERFILKEKRKDVQKFHCLIIVNERKHQCEIWYRMEEVKFILYSMN